MGQAKNTKRITGAMRLVAAAKVRRAQQACLQSRPFIESLQALINTLSEKIKLEGLELPLFSERDVKTVGLIVVTGDRGLCGSYNTKAINMAEKRIEELLALNIGVNLLLAGTKGQAYFKKRYNDNPAVSFEGDYSMNNSVDATLSQGICDKTISNFYAGDIDRIELVYTKFVSLIACEPSIRTMVPLAKTGLESEFDEMFRMTTKEGELNVEIDATENETKKFPSDTLFE